MPTRPPPPLPLGLLLLLVLLPACARRPPELPTAAGMAHYRIPWPNAFPSDVAVDDRGRLWFTDRLTHALGVFDPESESFRRLPTPTSGSAPYGLVRSPDGALWFGESNGRRLGRLDPETEEITELEVPGLRAGPRLLVWAGDAVWYTAQKDTAYGRYDPETGAHEVWTGRVPEPYGIAASGEAVWVASMKGSTVYRVDGSHEADTLPSLDLSEPAPAFLSEARLERLPPEVRARLRHPRRHAGIRRMAGDGAGRIWVGEWSRGRVTGVDPKTGERLHVETLDQPARPYGIAADAWGRVWFGEQGNETIVVYDPATTERRTLPLPVSGGTVRNLAVDAARGRVWVPLSDIGVIALVELRDGR